MPVEHNSPRDAALDALGSDEAIRFLACLSWELTLAARGEYGTQGDMAPASEYPLRSYNELLHRTSMQLCQAVGVPHGGCPDEAFLDMLRSEAARANRLANVEYAVRRTLRTLATERS
jgi:hypothetical protein